ncbi:copper homeostasis protein [Mesoplasma chauliocola]|uniref:Copper homeostasis protein cutC homolog n=1 Tax=Mesoplasma chauliocola TaxID=216427 RepID=A0A249SPN9_9MOLU|nr:copper homeostasis protein CutC [Mesoplasma chauliocola]ASZ09441.1 copper homeostasis protein [Mesoplasma chauliocola]
MKDKLLEVIAANINDIKIINESNADRIEFCKELKKGGFTPEYDDIKKACEISKLPINVMVRNTDRDFCYTEEEFKWMLSDIEFINSVKPNAIVIGILKEDKSIDIERMKIVKEKLDSKIKITFHKAFDEVLDKIEGLKILKELGVSTILTSGGANILENLKLLNELSNLSDIEILAGGGINSNNIDLVKQSVESIHVGTLARVKNSWDFECDLNVINEIKERIKRK